jgi:hypothetical protein
MHKYTLTPEWRCVDELFKSVRQNNFSKITFQNTELLEVCKLFIKNYDTPTNSILLKNMDLAIILFRAPYPREQLVFCHQMEKLAF